MFGKDIISGVAGLIVYRSSSLAVVVVLAVGFAVRYTGGVDEASLAVSFQSRRLPRTLSYRPCQYRTVSKKDVNPCSILYPRILLLWSWIVELAAQLESKEYGPAAHGRHLRTAASIILNFRLLG